MQPTTFPTGWAKPGRSPLLVGIRSLYKNFSYY